MIRQLGDFDLAEDALQEALVAALEQWPSEGVPRNPGAWLLTVARRRALDRLRRESSRDERQAAAVRLLEREPPELHDVPDDQLRLLFTCCHPALAPEARVALTLRTLGGLTTAEVARAFLVPEATMAQRLVRAKAKIRLAGIPYRVPTAEDLPERLASVLAVVYSIFTEGHSATAGDEVVRAALCDEAIRLARVLHELLPDEPEVAGLLALLLLQDARRAARTDPAGDLVLLEDQDRSRWDHARIREGSELLDAVLPLGRPGRYQVQAAIAALHGRAGTADEVDWPQIAGLYDVLLAMVPSPVVALNRAAAVAMADGPAAGLLLVDELADRLGGWHLFHATRADMLRRLDRHGEAVDAYERALALASSAPERRFLERRLRDERAQEGQGGEPGESGGAAE